MGSGEMTLWSSGVWLIPIILFAILGGLFLLARIWRQQTGANLKQLRASLRHYQGERRLLAQALAHHAIDDPEPYGSRVRAAYAQLAEIDEQSAAIERENVRLHERTRYLGLKRWQTFVGGPYFWYQLQKETRDLTRRFEALKATLADVKVFEGQISQLGWEVATHARQVHRVQQQVTQALDRLSEKNVHGEAMEAAARQEKACTEALSRIPAYFYQGDEETVLAQADKGQISQAHETLEKTGPALEQLLAQAEGWEKEYTQAAEKVAAMRKTLASAEGVLEDMPAGLNLATLKAHHSQLNVISQNLHATLSRLEVESMAPVREEAGRVMQAAHDLEKQLREARRRYAALESLLPDLGSGLRELSTQIATLGTRETHPVVWNQSRGKLTYLSRQCSAIGSLQKSRTLDQVEQDLTNAAKLNEQRKELATQVQAISQQHAELLSLLSSPELNGSREWLQAAKKIVDRTRSYDPDNWPRLDTVHTLADDIESLSERLNELVFANTKESLDEERVAERLDEVRNLALEAQSLHSRIQNIESRLFEITNSEKSAQEDLDRIYTALNQVNLLASSNPYLGEIISAELGRLQSSAQGLNAELDHSERGSVEKKARSVAALLARIEQTNNKWLDILNKDLNAQKKALADHLTELEAIAPLDEPAVGEARRLVSASQAFGLGSNAKSKLGLDELVLEMRRRSEHWQSCTATLRALEDVEGPLLDAYDAAAENREIAHQQVNDLAVALRAARAWPPTSVAPQNIRQELGRIDEQWEAVKGQPAKAISLVAQFSSLASKYQAISEKARQLIDRIAHEQAQVETLEGELDELLQAWQNQWARNRDNPMATEEIKRLLDELTNDRSTLKQQYRQGQKDYNQVLQGLQMQRRKARMAQVSIDDSHVIDVNGQVIAYR